MTTPSPPPCFPLSISPDLSLHPSTPTEQYSVLQANSLSFRGPLPTASYLLREAHLASQTLTLNGGLTGWVLVDTSVSPRRILCSCETIKKRALVARRGLVEEKVCHGVASVFCEEENRGRGYAGRMMGELGARLRGWQVEGGEREVGFSVLYSDIGKKFYAAYGWQPYSSSHIALPKTSPQQDMSTKIQPLYESSIEELCTVDEALMRKGLEKLARGHTDIYVALIPDAKTMQWHHAREEFLASELHLGPPNIKGAIVGREVGKRAWCIWTRKWDNGDGNDHGNTLFILRLVVENWDEIESEQTDKAAVLLAEAQRQAGLWNMKEVQIWNPTWVTLQAAQRLVPSVNIEEREEDSIASLMWYGDDGTHDDRSERVIWICNEKYGWC